MTRKLAVAIAMITLPSLVSAESRLAPPARPGELARGASAVVIGQLESQTPVQLSRFSRKYASVALTFTVDKLIKTHAFLHPEATLAFRPSPDRVTVQADDCDNCAIRKVRFEVGKQYMLFITWNEQFEIYSLHYSVAGAFRLDPDAVVPLDRGTDLVRNVRSLSKSAFLKEVAAGVQKP